MNKGFILGLVTTALMFLCFGIAWCLFIITGGINLENEYGEMTSKTFPIETEFTEVDFNGYGSLKIIQGDEMKLSIETQEGVMDKIDVVNRGDTLVLSENLLDDGFYILSYTPSPVINYTLTVTDLNKIELSGLGSIVVENFTTDNLTVLVSGAGGLDLGEISVENFNIDFDGLGSLTIDRLLAQKIKTDFKGAGSIEIFDGEVDFQELDMAGLGSFKAKGLKSNDIVVVLSGAGSAEVYATDTLDVKLLGMGSLDYYGNPSVRKDIEGLGSVHGHTDQ